MAEGVSGTGEAAVEAAMAGLAAGRLDGFEARDEEYGMTVTVVAKDSDRYLVRRVLDKPSHRDGWEHVRDDWRSGGWIRRCLQEGHWTLPAGAASPR